jgi:hypothetical protein
VSTCVIVPTFWARRRGRSKDRIINVYDHPTPIDQEGTLGATLRSLEQVRGLECVVVIVSATDASIEHEAEDRVREIVDSVPGVDARIFGPAELGSLHRRLEQLEFADMVSGVSLTGYGAVRNVGLIVAATLGCENAVFVDDDEIVTDPAFLETALEGIGVKTPDGRVVLAKTGYYLDRAGQWTRTGEKHWADAFWSTTEEFNRTMTAAVGGQPRLKPSTVAFGGCLALSRDIYTTVSFDPWVVRGEDVDYLINARMHGADIFLDNQWNLVHQPPDTPMNWLALRQDVYRFIYEHRKLEFAKSQVDLRQVTPGSLRPYPGDMVGSSVSWRAFVTALLHALTFKETRKYLGVAKAAVSDAATYARRNCDNYFAFQRRWPMMMDVVWEDVALGTLFSGERSVDRTAITGRFPVVDSE